MSTFDFPTLPELVARIQNDVKTELPESNPWLPNSWIRATIIGYAGRFSENYLQLNNVRNSLFIGTATNDLLDLWGQTYDIPRDPATGSAGAVSFVGTPGSVILVDAQLKSDGGILYETQADGTIAVQTLAVNLSLAGSVVTANTASPHTYATGMSVTVSGASSSEYNGTFTVVVVSNTAFTYTIVGSPPGIDSGSATANVVSIVVNSITFGADTNQESGAQLTLSNLIAGVDLTTFVGIDELTGGEDEQDDEAYRVPILFKRRNPGANNSVNGIKSQLFTINGITRIFVVEGEGEYTVYFVRDNDDNIIPSASEIAQARALLIADDYKPANLPAQDVFVLAPNPINVDFNFTFLAPNTVSMQSAIVSTLELFFRENSTLATSIQSIAYQSAIFNTVDPTTGEKVTAFVLSTPTGTILVGDGELALLGSVVFT